MHKFSPQHDSTPLSPAQLDELATIVGASGIRTHEVSSTLESGINDGNLDAGVVLFPESLAEVKAIVCFCNAQSISIVPHGGRTGISGGAESAVGQVIVQTTRLRNILSVDEQAGTAVVEAGVTLEQLQSQVNPRGLGVGIDLAARGTATIGGMVSTNAGGTEAFRHGVMRHRVLGLEAVLAHGRVFNDLKQVAKANEGFDIKQLLIGAEGTLGIVTKVALSLVPLPGGRVSALASCASVAAALRLMHRFRLAANAELLCVEIMWPDYARVTAAELGKDSLLAFAPDADSLFVILDVASGHDDAGREHLEQTLTAAFESSEITGAVVAKNERERAEFWLVRDESFLCDRRYPHGFWYDVSVPHRFLDDYVRELFRQVHVIHVEFKIFLFGHLGDGNLHLTVSAGRPLPELETAVEQAVYNGLEQMGGSFSAEHGIGTHKRAALVRNVSQEKLDIMREIKRLFDPNNVMNPAKIL